MNILIIYATNSGSTYSTVNQVSKILKISHTVTIIEALKVNPDDLSEFDVILLASPSWDYDRKEGQPHEHIITLMDMLKNSKLVKKFAIIGLGDRSYTYFCGAVDILEQFVKDCQGTLLTDSLRIDKYYTNSDSEKQVYIWTDQLLQKLNDGADERT